MHNKFSFPAVTTEKENSMGKTPSYQITKKHEGYVMTDHKKETAPQSDPKSSERRKAIKKIGIGIGAIAGISALPEKWTRPVIGQIVLPAHAATSAVSLHDPCTARRTSGTQDSNSVKVEISAWVDPPTANLPATIIATATGGAGNSVTVTTTTAADGTFGATISVGGGPGITKVSIVTIVTGAVNQGSCSVTVPPGDQATSTTSSGIATT